MKKVTLLIFIAISSQCSAQYFAPIGTIWHYTQYTFNPNMETFKTIESISDTTINGIVCKKMIEVERNISDTLNTFYHFMYIENDSVFFYADNDFHLLYDFGAVTGDTILLDYFSINPDSTLKMIIDSTGTVFINGEYRKIQFITCGDGLFFEFGKQVIEGIGNTSFMFPTGCGTINGPLRCYQDSIYGLYKNQFYPNGRWNQQDCDQILLGIDEEFSNEIVAYPNPVSESLFVKNIVKKTEYRIFDLFGKTVQYGTIGTSGEIKVDKLPKGIYVLEFEIGNHLEVEKIIKK